MEAKHTETGERVVKTWIRHYTNIAPKQGYIRVMEQTFESKNPRFRKKNLRTRVVKEIPISVEIPVKEYEAAVEHFDSSAIQGDDRFFSTTQKYKTYDKDICNALCAEALEGYNTEPIEKI